MDRNNQIYPLALRLLTTKASWKWFIKNLKDISGEPEDLVFISDRHVSISNATSETFLNTFHVMYTYHLLGNIKSRFKNNASTKLYLDVIDACCESQIIYY